MALFKAKAGEAVGLERPWMSGAPDDESKDGPDRFGQIHSAIGSGTKIEGKLSFDKPVRIDGELKGEILAPDVLVVIGGDAKIDARVEASVLVILGEVRGSVRALERVELLPGGIIMGDIETRQLVIQRGSVFNGNCKMPETEPPQETKHDESWLNGRKERDKKRKADSCRKPEGDEQKPEETLSMLVP